MAMKTTDDDDAISEINVTPLVDVVLVLLVIFMITAPTLYQSAIKLDLPEAQTGEESQKTPLEFALSEEAGDKKVAWANEWLSWEELESRLKNFKPPQDQPMAIISADKNTKHGLVVKLMDLLRKHGLTKFGLNVERPPTP